MTIAEAAARQSQVERTLPARWSPPTATLAQYKAHILRRLDEFEIRVTWRELSKMPKDVGGYCERTRNAITVPPMETEEDVAVVAHEMGHCCGEPHEGPLHVRDASVTRWSHCRRCEVVAWAGAIALMKPLPWSSRMHARLTDALRHHIQTPGPPQTLAELERLAAPLQYHRLLLDALTAPPPPPRLWSYEEECERARLHNFLDTFWKAQEAGR